MVALFTAPVTAVQSPLCSSTVPLLINSYGLKTHSPKGVAIELDALTSSNGSNFTVSLDGESYGPFSLYQNNSNGAIANVWGVTGLNPTVLHTFELHKFDNSDSQITIDAIRWVSCPNIYLI